MRTGVKLAGVAAASVLATLAAGAIAMTAMGSLDDRGLGHFGRADTNNDGVVTQAEWLAAATQRFQQLDANKDGKLAATELPRG